MPPRRTWQSVVFSDNGILILLALLRLVPLFLTNGQTGWHRDELDILDNARHLDWAYVSYPPVAPFLARVALTLFGPSLIGVRLFPTLAMVGAMLLTGLMAREFGGGRWAQALAAVAAAVAPYPLLGSVLFSYSSFDYFWWVLTAYLVVRLLKSGNPRWWLGIGAAVGVGLMTKYTMAFLVAGIVGGVLLTRTRRHLLSPWLWAGVGLAILIVLPNLIWQIQHDFISLDFTKFIHARDVSIGRTEDFLKEQLIFAANVVTIPLWLAGLWFFLPAKAGQNYRTLAAMVLVPFALLLYTQGRSYYLAPVYPMLFAGGAVMAQQGLARLRPAGKRALQGVLLALLAIGGVVFVPLVLPVAPVNSALWKTVSDLNGELNEQIGWPELVETVAGIYNGLPADEKPLTGILTGNYGEAGAVNLYGPAYGLPTAISGINSYWLRGPGDPPPQTAIVLGFNARQALSCFLSCTEAGRITNPYGVKNEESGQHPIIYLCREPRIPWPELWKRLKSYG